MLPGLEHFKEDQANGVDLYKVVELNEAKLHARHNGEEFTENYKSS